MEGLDVIDEVVTGRQFGLKRIKELLFYFKVTHEGIYVCMLYFQGMPIHL